jgi:DNA-binding NarL/FixJ family response regulator
MAYPASAIVADDHPLFREAWAEKLRVHFGFRIMIEAASLAEVFDHLKRIPDVALLSIDLTMKGMGADSLRALRRAYPNLRLVIVSASEQREDILLALGVGVHGYVPKTLSSVQLTSALQAVMEGGIFVPATLAAPALHGSFPNSQGEPPPQPNVGNLSPRQRAVMELIAKGKSNKEIARALQIAGGTVKVHVNSIFRLLGTTNRTSAVAAMVRMTSEAAGDPAGRSSAGA